MRLNKGLPSLLAAAALCASSATVSRAQPATGSQSAASAATAQNTTAVSQASKTPPLTEEALRNRLMGKTIFLREFYQGQNLQFDEKGKVIGSPATASFTLSAFEVKKVNLSKRKLEIDADRYGLHFFGALPYGDDSKSYDKVKISKKPVHITIARELVIIPKVKKKKEPKKGAKPGSATPATTTAASAIPAPAPAPGTTTSPAHSAMMMNTALDNVFATSIDERMMAHLPDYWQQYFKSERQHREFMPEDKQIKMVGDGVTAPKVLNSIDPSSNEYAQKYGIAGLTLFRTVVDASGKPQQIAIQRPIGFGLDEKAVDAIKASHFIPATMNGHPVPVVIDVVVTFRIFSNRTKPGSVPKGAKPAIIAASAWDGDASKNPSKALH